MRFNFLLFIMEITSCCNWVHFCVILKNRLVLLECLVKDETLEFQICFWIKVICDREFSLWKRVYKITKIRPCEGEEEGLAPCCICDVIINEKLIKASVPLFSPSGKSISLDIKLRVGWKSHSHSPLVDARHWWSQPTDWCTLTQKHWMYGNQNHSRQIRWMVHISDTMLWTLDG